MTVISTPGDVRPTRSESVHCRSKIGHPADLSELPQSMSAKLVEQVSLRNLSGSGAGHDAADVGTGDMMKDLPSRPDLCLRHPHLCILFRRLPGHLTGLLVQGICLPDLARGVVQSGNRICIFAVRT